MIHLGACLDRHKQYLPVFKTKCNNNEREANKKKQKQKKSNRKRNGIKYGILQGHDKHQHAIFQLLPNMTYTHTQIQDNYFYRIPFLYIFEHFL